MFAHNVFRYIMFYHAPVVGVHDCGFAVGRAGPKLAGVVSLSILGGSARPVLFSTCENVALGLARR